MLTHDWRATIQPEPANTPKVCRDCGQTWILTQRSRDWFAAKHLVEPRRCESCRLARREREAV